jgi:hypothetical protein
MWNWVHKNTRSRDTLIPEELYREVREQSDGITKMVVDAVTQYNAMLPRMGYYDHKDINERLITKAEEEAAQMFLEGILDMVKKQ